MKFAQFGKITDTRHRPNILTLKLRNKLGFPLHKLSVYVSPEKYIRKTYEEKDNLLIGSPDPSTHKTEILKTIQTNFPTLKTKIIKNMTYEQYKETISRAKWALTFGRFRRLLCGVHF